jgi:hypothetical protein
VYSCKRDQGRCVVCQQMHTLAAMRSPANKWQKSTCLVQMSDVKHVL